LRTNATPTAPEAAPHGSRVAFVAEFPPPVNAGFLEALRRADRAPWTEARTQSVRFAEDDGPLVQWRALVRLAPWRVLAALRAHAMSAGARRVPTWWRSQTMTVCPRPAGSRRWSSRHAPRPVAWSWAARPRTRLVVRPRSRARSSWRRRGRRFRPPTSFIRVR